MTPRLTVKKAWRGGSNMYIYHCETCQDNVQRQGQHIILHLASKHQMGLSESYRLLSEAREDAK